MKKIISLFLVLTISLLMLTFNASAFGGYAHLAMAGLKVVDSDRSEQAKLAISADVSWQI